ncbi:MAG TPA: MBL fold metallo-hydrolase [Gemmatimonadales bacterium]|nr:MBL fold metallo-hydrolase [Gemmatimonadales bacterium]
MTRLYVLGSGSKGNCFAVECDGATLLVEAGFSAREIERRAVAAGLALETVAGIVLTHEHGDHACGAPRLARQLGVPVLTAPGTWSALTGVAGTTHFALGLGLHARLGPFTVHACPTSHDAAEPIALVVECAEGAHAPPVRIGVATDLGRPTAAVRYLLRDLTAVVLEANFDEVRLRTSGYPPSVQQRIAGSGGHLSNRACAELLAEMFHPGLGTVVLAHLSQRCNSEQDARAAVEPALRRAGFSGTVHVALQDMPLEPIAVRAYGAQLGLAL